MPIKKIKNFLNEHHIKYMTIKHSPAYTALEIASVAHVSGKQFAKTVMVKIDGKMAMAVLPADERVDLACLKEIIGAHTLELATENEFHRLFPGCELGAMPPFGNLFGMDVFVAEEMSEAGNIVFNAGSHRELIQLSYKDFEKLVQPKRMAFATYA